MAVGAGRAFSKCAVLDQEAAADTKAVALPDKRPRFCEAALQGFTAHKFTPFQADGVGRVGLLTEQQQADCGSVFGRQVERQNTARLLGI